ncbi:glycerate kinase, partial [Streptococcus suis]
VENPLCGPAGAKFVFAGHLCLTSAEFELVDMKMESFYKLVNPMLLVLAGAGAGGGLAAGLVQFAGARIRKGIDFVLDQLDF